MNVVDSSAWLEYFADGPNADFFAAAIENTDELLVPAVSLYEVYKRVMQQRDESAALAAIGAMLQGRVVELGTSLALSAAQLSLELQLPMADSIMLASARAHGATLWTQDRDFENLSDVQYRPKQAP